MPRSFHTRGQSNDQNGAHDHFRIQIGCISKAQLHAATAAQTRLDAIESELNNAVVDTPLKPLIGAPDIEAAWEALTLAHQRFVIDTLGTVRILPVIRRGRGFDTTTIDIRFKEHRNTETAPDKAKAVKPARSPRQTTAKSR